jgi:hypothetical protein
MVPPKRYVCWFINPMNTINISPIGPINPNVKLELCEPQLNPIPWPGVPPHVGKKTGLKTGTIVLNIPYLYIYISFVLEI